MNQRLSYHGQIICEVASVVGGKWILCGGEPRWRLTSVENPAIVTHCCDKALGAFDDVIDDGCYRVDALGLIEASN